jgi:dTDP-4-amino-4,6-dideoxygalactose transaminase
VIEDCAQAYLARYRGRMLGAIGDIGCFSLQQGKHITTGEGGLVTTNRPDLARRMFLFINKAWGYGDTAPDHYFSALNYRMCELQGAVAVAQLAKLKDVVASRQRLASELTSQLLGLDGVEPPMTTPESTHTYWKYCLHVDGDRHENGAVRLGEYLKEHGIACAPRYIQKPAFRCDVIAKQRTLGSSGWPFTLARPDAVDYNGERYAGSFEALANILVLPWNENYTSEHVSYIAATVRDGAARLDGDKS